MLNRALTIGLVTAGWAAMLAGPASADAPSWITIDGDFSDWASVPSHSDPNANAGGTILHDGIPDVHDTDHDQPGDVPTAVNHPDVDLLEFKFTHDAENLYAYFRADGEIGRTNASGDSTGCGTTAAGRYYVIVTIDVDDSSTTGYPLHEGGYYPTSDGYDMNMEIEFYDDAFNTGHYLNHGAVDGAELAAAEADQCMGVLDVLPGSYDYYSQWVWWDDATTGLNCNLSPYPYVDGDASITWVVDKGPVYQGIIVQARSGDKRELEMVAPFRGFMKNKNDTSESIIGIGKTLNVSFSLEASGELSPDCEWATDTADPIIGYVLDGPPALDAYVAAPDATYAYSKVGEIDQPGFTAHVLDMTSQTWRLPSEVDRTEWQHYLVLLVPDTVSHETALLWVTGGNNGGGVPDASDLAHPDVAAIAALAVDTESVVAILPTVPNQPLKFTDDGIPREEDEIIAYTFDKYLSTGDETWPLLLPMVKSAVRAMDTAETYLLTPEGGSLTVDEFVVSGASKRGWTTWLTAAVDERVVAIAPMVIDVLNMDLQMEHHFSAYGFYSDAVHDYEDLNVFSRLATPEGQALLSIVDPYEYRGRFASIPKLMINSTGDQFFPPDSAQFYFDDLPGEKYLRYEPNTDHGLGGSYAPDALGVFYASVLDGSLDRPEFAWEVQADRSIRVQTDPAAPPTEVNLWQATDDTDPDVRSFIGLNTWTDSSLTDQGAGVYIGQVAQPPVGQWTAFFVELVYDALPGKPFKLTTEVVVTPEDLPHPQAPDCNENGFSDALDIASGVAADFNENGVPDECDGILYVDADATGANVGTSWVDAYTDLQDALAAAEADDQIWVAAGIYTPTNAGGNRNDTFQLVNGIMIYGGFGGAGSPGFPKGEFLLEYRNPALNRTILSGDLNADDAADAANNTENSYQVVTGSGTDATAVLDGFVITGGNANGTEPRDRGAGVYNDGGSPTLVNCVVEANVAHAAGGGIFNANDNNLTLVNCALIGNTANLGGGLVNDDSAPQLVNTVFQDNTSDADGGAIFNNASDPVLTNCTLAGNVAGGNGGGLCNDSSNPVLRNCILWGNTDAGGSDESAQIHTASGTPDVAFSCVEGLLWFIGNDNIGDDPSFADSGVRLADDSPCIDAGDNDAVPADIADLDDDGDVAEPTALDAARKARFVDDPNTIDIGELGSVPEGVVDMGAFEFGPQRFVDADAAAGGDGTTWATAYNELQAALADVDVQRAAVPEIWVAAGTYVPGTQRADTMELPEGVAILGGFAGDETSAGARDPSANVCVLSGDIGTGGDASDNSFHVVTAVGVSSGAVLDGFTITGGNANGGGDDDFGGGMFVDDASPLVANCTFTDNAATSGGGGLFGRNGASPSLVSCVLADNTAAGAMGGGLYSDASGPRLANCVLSGNTAKQGGGAAYTDDSDAELDNCTFSTNTAPGLGGLGGGIYSENSDLTLDNCVLWDNDDVGGSDESAQIHSVGAGSLSVATSCIQGLTSLAGAGNVGSDPLFVDADLRLDTGSPCIDVGSDDALPADEADLDGDGDRLEPLSLDLDGKLRIANDTVDMGAYEFGAEDPPDPGDGGPTADAGLAQTVNNDARATTVEVTLDGSASAGTGLSYSWSEDGTEIATGVGPTVTLTVDNTVAEDVHTITLTVTDADDKTDTDTVAITVETPVNTDPVAVAVASPTMSVGGGQVTLDGRSSSDADGDALTFSWTQTVGEIVSIVNASQAVATFTAPMAGPMDKVLTIQLTVSDGHGGTDTVAVTVTVPGTGVTVNQPPSAVAAASDDLVAEGTVVTLDAGGSSDPDGDVLAFIWRQLAGTPVALGTADAAVASFTAPAFVSADDSLLQFEVTVSDGRGGVATALVAVVVANPADPGAPGLTPLCGMCGPVGVVGYGALLVGWAGLNVTLRRRYHRR